MDECAKALIATLREQGKTVSTAESCTGGLIGKTLTDVPGSSAVYPGGVISYCSAVKHNLLGVSQTLLDTLGAVSAPVAAQMAEGARRVFSTDFAVSVTGIAGPQSDDSGKPAGMVYIAATDAAGTSVQEFHFSGDREAVRAQACQAALEMLAAQILH